jgi:hypothetical protein
MANNNLADISTFENLQNQANSSFGGSQMSAFQENVTVNNSIADVQKAYTALEKVNAEWQKAKEAVKKADEVERSFKTAKANMFKVIRDEYNRIGDVLKQNPNDATALKEKRELEALDDKANAIEKAGY